MVESLEQDVMSGEVEKCPILHVRPKFDVFTLQIKREAEAFGPGPGRAKFEYIIFLHKHVKEQHDYIFTRLL